MTRDPRFDAFQKLGFSARQSAFLALVALHSGFCLRRQYVRFAGVSYGKNTSDFLDSLVSRQLADRFSIRPDRGYIYHLNARTIYRLLNLSDSRNRRTSSSSLIARKVMVLDRVLSQPGHNWLATPDEKVKFFANDHGIPVADLPQRRLRRRSIDTRSADSSKAQFFPYALPIDVTCNEGGVAAHEPCATAHDPGVTSARPRATAAAPGVTAAAVGATADAPGVNANALDVTFMCLLTHAGSDDFTSFLRQHAPLFCHLPAWRVLAIAPERSRALDATASLFAAFLAPQSARPIQRAAQLREFFTTRRTIDRGHLASLSVAEIDKFRTLRSRFNSPVVDALYRSWLTAGDAVLASPPDSTPRFAVGSGTLITEYLPHDYSQFGSLPGVA